MAFVLPSLHGGGAERAAVTLLNALPTDRFEPVLYLFSRDGAYANLVAPHVRTVLGAAGRWGRLTALRSFIREQRIDVVVSFLSHFSSFVATRLAGNGAKFVISQQTPLTAFLDDADYAWRQPLRRRVFERVARAVYPRVDLIAATSPGVGDDLIARYGARREQVVIVPNPVDVAEVERRQREPLDTALDTAGVPTIVTAGRLADAKNLPLLVDALALLAGRQQFRAWILGQGELEGDLRARLAAAALTDRVHLLGFQANPWKFLSKADVFVLTSRYEGFGNVLIEAMACGQPVVATASPGTRAIVQDGINGLLVEAHEPAAVAAALERVLTEPGLRAGLASAVTARAREFSLPVVVDRFAHVVAALVPQVARA